MRKRRHGSTADPERRAHSAAERFWPKVDRSGGPDACWPWTGFRLASGYGEITDEHGTYYAHRLAWASVNGPIPVGMYICHSCDNPPCCNVAHLFLGTPLDNVRDMLSKGRRVSKPRLVQCWRGHDLAGTNLYVSPQGRRYCRACHVISRANRRLVAARSANA